MRPLGIVYSRLYTLFTDRRAFDEKTPITTDNYGIDWIFDHDNRQTCCIINCFQFPKKKNPPISNSRYTVRILIAEHRGPKLSVTDVLFDRTGEHWRSRYVCILIINAS